MWINLPNILCGILSLLAAFSALILPETLNKTLPQTVEDTEQMGLAWYVCLPNYFHLQTNFLTIEFSHKSRTKIEMHRLYYAWQSS